MAEVVDEACDYCYYFSLISLIEVSGYVPKILLIALPNRSWDAFALNTSLLGLKLPHGVLKVATDLDSRCNTNWWYPCWRSSFVQIMQSWNLWMKPSTINACEIQLLSMCLFETRKLSPALITCGSSLPDDVPANFGFGCTTMGEHHVTGSSSGTFSKVSSFTPCSSHFLRGSQRKYGTCLELFQVSYGIDLGLGN